VIRSLLPLPSSDWRDFSQDWFCGCCEGHKGTISNAKPVSHTSEEPSVQLQVEAAKSNHDAAKGIPAEIDDVTEQLSKLKTCEHFQPVNEQTTAEARSNKQLTGASLDPQRSGDVFYTGFALFLSRQNFEQCDPFKLSDLDNSVSCKQCDSELGLCDQKIGLFQFWHDAIFVTRRDAERRQRQRRRLSKTFCRIVDGFVSESFGQSVKIHFSTKSRRLFLWVIEPNLRFLTAVASEDGGSCFLAENESVKKVLFQVSLQNNQ